MDTKAFDNKEVFEFLSMDKKINEKEIENYLKDSRDIL